MTQSIQDKLDHFATFISLLTGAMEVQVSTAETPVPGTIVLPRLENLDQDAIKVLYGLCLREAGYLSRSRKTVTEVAALHTQRELQAAFMLESARVERFLSRRFGGGAEVLDEHFGELVHNARFTNLILGVDPQKAQADEVFLYALRWQELGRPRWKWDQLFPKNSWEKAIRFLDDPALVPYYDAPHRKFQDSVDRSRLALSAWYQATKTKDSTEVRVADNKQKAWEKAMENVEQNLMKRVEKLQENLAEEMVKIEKYREDIQEEKARLAPFVDPLKDQQSLLQESAKSYGKLSKEARTYNKAEKELLRLQKKLDSAQKQLDRIQNTKNKWEDRLAKASSSDEKIKRLEEQQGAINQKNQEQQARLDEKDALLRNKESEILEKFAQDDLSESKREKLEEKLHDIQQKRQELQQKKQDLEEARQQQLQKLQDKLEQLEEAASVRSDAQDIRSNQLSDQLEKSQETLGQQSQTHAKGQEKLDQSLEELGRQMMREGVDVSMDDVKSTLENLSKDATEKAKVDAEIKKLEAHLSALQEAMRESQKSVRAQTKKEEWNIQKELIKMEQSLGETGVNANLSKKMKLMEGWDEANQTQANFDDLASNELEMSVINGSGGGQGNRNMLMQVQEVGDKIKDLDPNVIFADVQRLSPLSGFSESGVREGDGGVNKKTPNETLGQLTVRRHSVWSKSFDRIIPAPTRNAQLINQLRRQYATDIQKVKKVFTSRFKPSYKSKFVGNRDEGDLDSRSMWKLAAQQGDDFFEVIRKRPDHKGAATILVDLSGSCASWDRDEQDATTQIQALVLMLAEGFQAVNIPYEILGFHAPIEPSLATQPIPEIYNRKSCRLETIVAKGFRDKDLSGLASLVVQQTENSDGESLRIAVSRLAKQSGKSKMVVMISDGKPFMQDADPLVLDADLRLALEEAASKKIVVTGLGFAHNHPVLGHSYASIETANDLPKVLDEKLLV